MQPSSFLDDIAQQPEFLSAVSHSDIESLINCATPKRLSSLIKESTKDLEYVKQWCVDLKIRSPV